MGETARMPFIQYDRCEGCGGCAEVFPALFVMRDDLAWFINPAGFTEDMAVAVEACCPFRAIKVQ